MSRDAGFLRADIDTGLHADPKIVSLARRLRDPGRTAVAVCLYTGLVLASWKAGDRVTLEESAPAWFLEPVDEIRTHLHAAELVDDEGRIPVHAWASWYEPAHEKREKLRVKWAAANRNRGGNRGGTAAETPTPRHDTTRHDTPVPLRAVRSTARGADTAPPRGVPAAPDEIEADRV